MAKSFLVIGPFLANALHGSEVGIIDALKKNRKNTYAYDHRKEVLQWKNGDTEHMSFEYLNERGRMPIQSIDYTLVVGPGLPEKILESRWWKYLRDNAETICWNSEPVSLPQYYAKLSSQIDQFDHLFTFDEEEIPIYEKMGKEAKFLAQGFFEDWYKPLSNIELVGNMCFVGSIGGKWQNRNHFLSKIKQKYNINIFSGIMNANKVNEIYNRHKFVINIGLHYEDMGPPNNLKSKALQQRIFEAYGSGKVCLSHFVNTDIFEDKKDIVFYRPDNLFDQIDFLLCDKNREKIEQNIAKNRNKHSYVQRIKEMIETL